MTTEQVRIPEISAETMRRVSEDLSKAIRSANQAFASMTSSLRLHETIGAARHDDEERLAALLVKLNDDELEVCRQAGLRLLYGVRRARHVKMHKEAS